MSQSSSQENLTGSNVSNNLTVTLEVFSYNVLVLYSRCGLLVISCCPTLHFLGYDFPVTQELVLRLRNGCTWSVMYSVGLAMIQFLLMLGDNQLFYIMFWCCSGLFSFLCLFLMNEGCYISRSCFFCCFFIFYFCQLRTKEIIYAVYTYLFVWPHSCVDRFSNVSWASALCHKVV